MIKSNNKTALIILFSILNASAYGQVKQLNNTFTTNPFQAKKGSSSQIVLAPKTNDTIKKAKLQIENYNGSFYVDLSKENKTTEQLSKDFNSWFNIDTNHTFVLLSSKTDELNLNHNYYQQYYKGLSIEGAILMLHSKNGIVYASNGQIAQFEKIEVESKISTENSILIAKEHLKVKDLINTYPVETIIAKIPNGISFEYKYVHKVRIDSSNPFVMANVFIDAINGSVLNTVSLFSNCMNTTSEAINEKKPSKRINFVSSKPENIILADTPATANTLYSGTQSIITDSYNGAYRLRDNARKIETYDATNASDYTTSGYPNSIDYINNSTTWGTFPSLKIFTISTLSTNNWWNTILGDSSPDLYIKVKNASNAIVYNGRNSHLNNTTFATFNLNIQLVSQPYTVEIWDFDPVGGDDFGGSYVITTTSGNWSVNGNNGSYYVLASGFNPALDVHWGMEKTYDFFLNVFSRNSFDRNGSVIKNYINPPDFQLENNNSPNQAAAAPPPYNFMVYGLGDIGLVDNPSMKPLVGLDVEGHEYSHMVINYRQNLTPPDPHNVNNSLKYEGESGALNESFADIFGTCVEFYAKPSTANWTIGEDVKLPNGTFLRSMSNPILGSPPQPDTYKGLLWYNPNCGTPSDSNDKCGVHINSGVQNFWFYLLSQNTSTPIMTGTNDLGYQYSVTSIGINKAREITYRNLTTHLPSYNSTYMDSYFGSLLSAQELYGPNSQEYNSVRQAWYAVGIGNSPNSPCSGTTNLTASSGTFTDGSGLANYSDNANCTWLIKPAGATQISLNFSAFNTEATYDLVRVYNGPDDTYPLLGTFSGSTLPSTISTTAGIGAMCVKFTSDTSNTFSGWTASYTSLVTTPACSDLTMLTTPTGSFSDGSGSNNYTNNQQCLWYIAPPCATSVTLSFTSFNTELNYDGVAIYDSLTATTPIASFTGTSLPTSVTSSTGVMIIAFISDFSTTSQGFSANYTSTGSSFCSGTTTLNTADYGTISDGSGTNNYCNNSNCSWLIQPPNATSITLNFTAFDLEQASVDGITIYDVVEVYDGTSSSAPLLNKFFGNNIPPAVTSTSGSMFIKFTSSISDTYQGWSAYYTSTQNSYCNSSTSTLTASSGTFTDGSGVEKYANNSECSWLIQPTNANTVTLSFSSFDTELNYDGVIVFNGTNSSAPVLGQFTGTTLPPSVTSSGGSMYVVFISDEALRSNGWTANYNSTTLGINDFSQNENIKIYPNPTSGIFSIQSTLDENIKVQIFDILGKQVLKSFIINKGINTIDACELSKGIYQLKFNNEKGSSTQKLIIN
ncbi:CUB domain-containing protein [Flavobacterium sp.]|jgi:Zn-dependent metalloprotease|uniref:CUB domain-containing protein n=1 Tax=Flavobacterium sp. TaxID=239 RepID=UPI0037BEEF4C